MSNSTINAPRNRFVSAKTKAPRNRFVSYQADTIVQSLPPREAPRPVPDIQDGIYSNTPEFKDIVERGAQDPDSLTRDEKRQFEAAVDQHPEIKQYVDGDRGDREKGLAMMRAAEVAGQLEEVIKSAKKATVGLGMSFKGGTFDNVAAGKEFLKATDELISGIASNELNFGVGKSFKEATGKTVSETVDEILSEDIGLKEFGPDATVEEFDPETKNFKTRKMTTTERATNNLVIGAVKLTPLLWAGLVDNPTEFAYGLAKFPVEEISLIHAASNGLGEGMYTDEEVAQAQEEIVQNPVGLVMLGFMALGVGRGLSRKIPQDIAKFEKSAKEADVAKTTVEKQAKEIETLKKPKPEVKKVEPPTKVEKAPEKPPVKAVEPLKEPVKPEVKVPEKVEPLPEKPKVVETGNKPSDAARNLAHAKRFQKSVEERIAKPEGADAKRLEKDLAEATKDVEKFQKIFDVESTKLQKPELPDVPVVVRKLSEIKVDPERFQGRKAAFAEETATRIFEEFDPVKLEAVIVWKDPADGATYILSGHSRYEGLTRLRKETLPTREFKGTEAEAIQFSKVEANRLQKRETLTEDIEAFKSAEKEGKSKKAMKNIFGRQLPWLESYSKLDTKGKFLDILAQEDARKSFPYLEQKARDVGELRRDFPELTNRHEGQIFEAMYGETKMRELPKAELRDIIEKQLTDALWKPENPLIFKRGQVPTTGTRARKDTAPIMRKIDDLEQSLKKARTVEETQALQSEISTLKKGLDEVVKTQQDMFTRKAPKPIRNDVAALVKRNEIIRDDIIQTKNSLKSRPLEDQQAATEYVDMLEAEYIKNRIVIDQFVETGGEVVGDGLTYMRGGLGIVPPSLQSPTLGVIPVTTKSYITKIGRPRDWNTSDYLKSPSNSFHRLNPNAGKVADLGHDAVELYATTLDKANVALNGILHDLRKDIKGKHGLSGYFTYRKEFTEGKNSLVNFLDRKVSEADLANMRPEVRKAYTGLRQWYEGYRERIIKERRADGLETPDNWGIGDYLTHLFRGNWRLEMKVEGKWQLVKGGIGETEAIITKTAKGFLEKDPTADLRIRWDTNIPGDMVSRLSKGAYHRLVNDISKKMEILPEEVREVLYESGVGTKPKKRKHFKFAQQRTGLKGYEQDLVPILETYAAVTERYLAMNELRRKAVPLLEKIDKELQPRLYEQVSEYIDVVSGKRVRGSVEFDNWLQTLPLSAGKHIKPMAMERWARGATKFQALRLLSRPSTALLNRTQVFTTVYPRVGESIFLWGMKEAFTKKGRKFAEDNRVTTFSPTLYSESALTKKGLATRASDKPLYLFNKAEQQNRIEAFLMGHRYAKKILKYPEEKAIAYGKNMVRQTQFDNSVADVQPIFRHPIARTIFQFKPFQFKYIEQATKLRGKEIPRSVLAHGITGGMKTIAKPINWLVAGGMIKMYQYLRDEWGETTADLITYGLPGLLGADMSASLGIDIIPFGRSWQDKMANLLTGPTGSFTTESVRTMEQLLDTPEEERLSQLVLDVTKLMPIVRPGVAAYELVTGEHDVRDARGDKIIGNLSAKEHVARIIGLYLIRQSQMYDLMDLSRTETENRTKAKRAAWAAFTNDNSGKMSEIIATYNDEAMATDGKLVVGIDSKELYGYFVRQYLDESGFKFEDKIPNYNHWIQIEMDKLATEGK